jgi:hypothetical protein
MCYQVSDTRSRNRQIRRTALSQALLVRLGGAIVGSSVNLIACLIRSIPAVRKVVRIRLPRPLLAECEYVGLDAGCEEGHLEGAVVN